MTDTRALLDAYAERTNYEAPYAFAALRTVLDECDREDRESIGIVSTERIRAAIAKELETR